MSDAERWLIEWHGRRPGATSRCFARARPSSYAWLADLAHPGDRALDLACGDGLLLEMLVARGLARSSVFGVDMSPSELGAARARLGDAVTLVEGRAQALPFEDASFDIITCHLAFMLMSPIDEVVREVMRVLRPGGRFAAVVGGGPRRPDDAWTRAIGALSTLAFSGPKIGDKRASSEAGLRDMLGSFSEVHIEPLVVDLSGSADDIWDLFVNTYTFDMMSTADVTQFEGALRSICAGMQGPDGSVPCSMGFWAVCATKPA